MKDSVILVIPDLHCPFEHKDTVRFLRAVKRKFKPTRNVCLGDEADFHANSFHDSDPDGMSAGDEHKEAKRHLKPIFRLFPQMDVCTSNHTAIPFRKAFAHGLPKAFIKSYGELLDAPEGWRWKDSFTIDGVKYEHGENFSGREGALKSAIGNMQSTVIGHLHTNAGILWLANARYLIFGFNVGCLIDHKKYAFAYAKKIKNKPTIGCGIVINGVPQFIPMLLDKKGNWVGKL